MNLPPHGSREDGMEVLAFHYGKWRHVKWSSEHQGWALGRGGPFIMDAGRPFAKLPKKPPHAPGFYDHKVIR